MIKHNKGFTIVEMILYMALMAVFILVLVELFVSIMKLQTRTENVSASETDTRFLMQRISYDLTNSETLTTTSSNQLSFTNGGEQYSYALDSGGRFTITKSGVTDYLTGADSVITDLNFIKINNSVKVSFVLNEKAFQSTFNLR